MPMDDAATQARRTDGVKSFCRPDATTSGPRNYLIAALTFFIIFSFSFSSSLNVIVIIIR